MRRQVGQHPAVGDAGFDIEIGERAAEGIAGRGVQPVEAFARAGADRNGVGIALQHLGRGQPRSARRSILLSTSSVSFSSMPSSSQHFIDGADLLEHRRIRGVGHVQQQVGLPGLFERGLEAGDQAVRQVADEADRVARAAPAPSWAACQRRVRVSSVANSLSAASTPAPVRAFISVLLPAFV